MSSPEELDLDLDAVLLELDAPAATALSRASRAERNAVFAELYGDIVRSVAKREHRQSTTTTREDLEQELFLFFYSRMDSIARFSEPGIRSLAITAARDIMLRERLDYMYFSGAYVYIPPMVSALLKECVWTEVDGCPDIEGRMDVTIAVKELPLETQRLLFGKYALGEAHDVRSAAYKRVERAIDTITHRLNMGSVPYQVDIETA